MQFPFSVISGLLLGGLLVGCGGLKDATQSVTGGRDPFASPDPYGGIPDELRAGSASGQVRTRVVLEGEDPAASRSRTRSSTPNTTLLTPEDQIVWTDPDNPDAALPGLEDLIRVSKTEGTWDVSYTNAKKRAMRDGKPLLVWFTDSQRSPVCKTLSAELFSTPDFESWALNEVVRVRLDFNVTSDGSGEDQMDREIRKRDYLKMLEKRFNVRGKPYVLVQAPDGTTIQPYRGYRPGSSDFYWGKLKHSVIIARKHHEGWLKSMEAKGYRTWTNRGGDFHVFAKLLRYLNGELILVEPDGGRFRTKEANLSDADRLWIAGQKARRQ